MIQDKFEQAYALFSSVASESFAVCMIGFMLQKGFGMKANVQQAALLYEKIIKKNDLGIGYLLLGLLYEKGIVKNDKGITGEELFQKAKKVEREIPYESVLDWLKTKARAGHGDIACLLGLFYEIGIDGVAANKTESMEWYTVSSSTGDSFAKARLDKLSNS